MRRNEEVTPSASEPPEVSSTTLVLAIITQLSSEIRSGASASSTSGGIRRRLCLRGKGMLAKWPAAAQELGFERRGLQYVSWNSTSRIVEG